MQSHCQAEKVMLAAQQQYIWEAKRIYLNWLGEKKLFVCSRLLC